MTLLPANPVCRVRLVFATVLVLLLVPARWMAPEHGANFARFAGATLSTLLVCWLLYRLSVRAARQAWFVVISILALYTAVFAAPLYPWATLLVMVPDQ